MAIGNRCGWLGLPRLPLRQALDQTSARLSPFPRHQIPLCAVSSRYSFDSPFAIVSRAVQPSRGPCALRTPASASG
ncbi:hypothetical protein FKP32DRAFT_1071892 [Trametes sanguinea]|nr:hypothetical protein FKP32DRAFT_1071892 [Trametes sanguinea]